jgi:hypothetical protein
MAFAGDFGGQKINKTIATLIKPIATFFRRNPIVLPLSADFLFRLCTEPPWILAAAVTGFSLFSIPYRFIQTFSMGCFYCLGITIPCLWMVEMAQKASWDALNQSMYYDSVSKGHKVTISREQRIGVSGCKFSPRLLFRPDSYWYSGQRGY